MRRIVLGLFLVASLAFCSAGYQPTNVPNGLGVGEAIRPYSDGQVTYNLDIECDNLEVSTINVNTVDVTSIEVVTIDAEEIVIQNGWSTDSQLIFRETIFNGFSLVDVDSIIESVIGTNQYGAPVEASTIQFYVQDYFTSSQQNVAKLDYFNGFQAQPNVAVSYKTSGDPSFGIKNNGLGLKMFYRPTLSNTESSIYEITEDATTFNYKIPVSFDEKVLVDLIEANSLIGDLTGDVVGNLVGNVTANQLSAGTISANSLIVAGVITANQVNATNLTGTLQTATQPNITSLGTLTGLNVSGASVLTGALSVGGVLNVETTSGINKLIFNGNEDYGIGYNNDAHTTIFTNVSRRIYFKIGGIDGTPVAYFKSNLFNVAVDTTFAGAVSVSDTTSSTSTTTGALTVAGGVGIAENLNVGGDIATVGWTSWSASSNATGFSSIASEIVYYKKVGHTVTVYFSIDGTSNATTFTFTLPYQARSGINFDVNIAGVKDNGTYSTGGGFARITASSSTVSFYKDHAFTAFTASGQKVALGSFSYEAQ